MSKHIALIFGFLLLLTACGSEEPDFARGEAAFNNGNFAAALKEWQPLAVRGDAKAQYRLALMYAKGQGVRRDPEESMKLLRAAARSGHLQAKFEIVSIQAKKDDPMVQLALADLYLHGRGVKRDTAAAAKWYRKAAEKGNPKAQYKLGEMFAEGLGVSWDYAEAANWYRKAAAQGEPLSQYRLGLLSENGQGVPKDFAEAAKWYAKAAAKNHPPAQYRLGLFNAEGKGLPKDAAAAIFWYRKAVEKKHPAALAALGRHYASGIGVPVDYVQAYMWFSLATVLGDKSTDRIQEELLLKMSKDQLSKARALTAQWLDAHKDNQPGS